MSNATKHTAAVSAAPNRRGHVVGFTDDNMALAKTGPFPPCRAARPGGDWMVGRCSPRRSWATDPRRRQTGGSAMTGDALKFLTLVDGKERQTLDFVLPGLLSGNVGLIVGQGAVGKSMLALSIGLGVATGRKVAGGLWTPGGVGPVVI